MGVSVLVLGPSESGKSTSMRNFAPDEVGIFNVASKPLPFRGSLPKVDAAGYDVIKAEEKALAERRRSKEKRIEWLKGYLVSNFERMGKKGIETPRCKVTTRTTKRVEVVDEDRVPVDFIRVKEERTVDKKAIMAAFKCGTYVPGAELVSSTSATVRTPCVR